MKSVDRYRGANFFSKWWHVKQICRIHTAIYTAQPNAFMTVDKNDNKNKSVGKKLP